MAQVIDALSNLMWPLLVVAVLLLFRGPVTSVIESARQREFTVKIGGQEIDMKELSQQQDKMIADLQGRLGELNQQMAKLTKAPPAQAPAREIPVVETEKGPVASAVLWVDDHPEENALIIDRLERNGIRVDTAESTNEAIRKLSQRRYGAVISDMVRSEAGVTTADAGLRLLESVRSHSPSLPFLIYSNAPEAQTERIQALASGATLVSSSAVSLVSTLGDLGLPAT